MVTEQRFITYEEARDIFSTKADLARAEGQLEARMAQMEPRLIKWMIGSQVGLIVAVAAIMRFLS